MDAINLARYGTSPLVRDWRRFIGLFIISAPPGGFLKFLNRRVLNWHYQGRELYKLVAVCSLVSSLSFFGGHPRGF